MRLRRWITCCTSRNTTFSGDRENCFRRDMILAWITTAMEQIWIREHHHQQQAPSQQLPMMKHRIGGAGRTLATATTATTTSATTNRSAKLASADRQQEQNSQRTPSDCGESRFDRSKVPPHGSSTGAAANTNAEGPVQVDNSSSTLGESSGSDKGNSMAALVAAKRRSQTSTDNRTFGAKVVTFGPPMLLPGLSSRRHLYRNPPMSPTRNQRPLGSL